MSKINDIVRRRIRRIRKSRKVKLADAAKRAGMAKSTYAALEYGDSRIRIDSLDRIIRALEVDILEVWPAQLPEEPGGGDPKDINCWANEFRLSELVRVADSSGAALFWIAPTRSRVLLSWNLHDSRLQRLLFWLEERCYASPPDGVIERPMNGGSLSLFIDQPRRLAESKPFLQHYMNLWAQHLQPASGGPKPLPQASVSALGRGVPAMPERGLAAAV